MIHDGLRSFSVLKYIARFGFVTERKNALNRNGMPFIAYKSYCSLSMVTRILCVGICDSNLFAIGVSINSNEDNSIVDVFPDRITSPP